jgi:hypothetical protein
VVHGLGNEPLRCEVLRFSEVYLHYSALKIPFTFHSVLCCALTGIIRDPAHKENSGSSLIKHPHNLMLNLLTAVVYAVFVPVPHDATVAFILLAVGMYVGASPSSLFILWSLNYSVELWFRRRIHLDHRWEHDDSR